MPRKPAISKNTVKNSRWTQGLYVPENPTKYRGDVSDIIYRSTWERRFMIYLDRNENVEWWTSEALAIPYVSPVDNSVHHYIPDFIVAIRSGESRETVIVEVKPNAKLKRPTYCKTCKKTKRLLETYNAAVIEYMTNFAKFDAAKKYADSKGWKFVVVTEQHPVL